jgi:hypothetical protein
MLRRLAIATTLVLAACASGWRQLGTTVAARGMEREVIRVAEWRDELRAIRIDVDVGSVVFRDVVVRYGSGRTHSLGRNFAVRRGRAVVFDLPGGVRDVEGIMLVYESIGMARGVVTVSGR